MLISPFAGSNETLSASIDGPREARQAADRNADKCVLLICFRYPPAPFMGAARPAGLAKYLREFGWRPLVLTPRLDGTSRCSPDLIETDYHDVVAQWKARLHLDRQRSLHEQLGVRLTSSSGEKTLHARLIESVATLLTYPDRSKGWISPAANALNDIARSCRVAAIISTAPPFAAHIIAARAKRLFNCPWIADYRDLWNVNEQTLGEATGLLAALLRRTESNVLKNADALVTVSEPWAGRLRKRYPAQKVSCISNGFDEDLLPNSAGALTETFTITHTGQLYEGRRDPSPLLQAVQELIADGTLEREKVRVRFYGPPEPGLMSLVARFALRDVVEVHPAVPRQESLRLQRESQLLLLLHWWYPGQDGMVTGKVYEYLGSGRPVIAIGGGRGAVTTLLESTGGGFHADSVPEVKDFLRSAYAQFRRTGAVAYHGRPEIVKKFTHREMARSFARLLDSFSPQTHIKVA